MSKGTVRVILDLHFDGDYYGESERAGMAETWIDGGLEDRSDLRGWTYVETNHRAGNGSLANNYVMLDGTRYKIETVEDQDTMDVVDGVAYCYLSLACSYPINEEDAS